MFSVLNPFKAIEKQPAKKPKRGKVIKTEARFTTTKVDSPLIVQRRAYQKRINITVKPNGSILVTASKSTTKREIESFLLNSEDWIAEQINFFANLKQAYPQKTFVDGENWLFMGRGYPLKKEQAEHRIKILIEDYQLIIRGKGVESLSFANLQKKLFNFYTKAAKEIIGSRLKELSQSTGLVFTEVKFKTLNARWGSCSASGVLTFNWKLIAAPPKVIDYVIIHELCHLVHQNHSSAFWGLVGHYHPTYKHDQAWLRNNTYSFDFLNEKSEIHK